METFPGLTQVILFSLGKVCAATWKFSHVKASVHWRGERPMHITSCASFTWKPQDILLVWQIHILEGRRQQKQGVESRISPWHVLGKALSMFKRNYMARGLSLEPGEQHRGTGSLCECSGQNLQMPKKDFLSTFQIIFKFEDTQAGNACLNLLS